MSQAVPGDQGLGVLFVHGFTGSPASMQPWADEIAATGHDVAVPLLPGHGTRWQDLNATTWHDWYAAAETQLLELTQVHDTVVVAGLSMGGALALRLAEQHPRDVDGLVLVNPALSSDDPRLRLLPVLKHLVPSLAAIGDDIKKPGVTEGAYPRTPLKALHSMTRLWRDVVAGLDRVACPVELLRSREDHVVDGGTLGLLTSGPVAAHVHVTELLDSYHVATLDHDFPVIVERTLDLIDRLTTEGAAHE